MEIKFRAWDGKEMIYRGLHDRNWYTDGKGGKVVFGAHPDDANQLQVMQFVGLKDKNGVEIYCGDILKWIGRVGEHNGIEYHNQVYFLHYRYRIKGTISGKTFHTDLKSHHIFNHDCEVIGNIHTTPELLNVKTK